jgi:hypothetical protein
MRRISKRSAGLVVITLAIVIGVTVVKTNQRTAMLPWGCQAVNGKSLTSKDRFTVFNRLLVCGIVGSITLEQIFVHPVGALPERKHLLVSYLSEPNAKPPELGWGESNRVVINAEGVRSIDEIQADFDGAKFEFRLTISNR